MNRYEIELNLSEEMGQIMFDKKEECVITYAGYNFLNNIVGASIFMPDKIFIDGEEKENPYIITGEDGGVIEVISSAVAVSTIPNVVMSASTVRYNVEITFTNALVELVAASSKAGSITKTNLVVETDDTIIRPINSELSVVANLSYPGVLDAIKEYSSDRTLGERRAVSLAQRNALKKLPQFALNFHVEGQVGFRVARVKLTLYANEQDKDIIACIERAKHINAYIATRKLNLVNSEQIIDANTTEKIQIDRELTNNSVQKGTEPISNIEAQNKVSIENTGDSNGSLVKNTSNQVQSTSEEKKNIEPKSGASANNSNNKSSEGQKEKDLLRKELLKEYKQIGSEKVDMALNIIYPGQELNKLSLDEIRLVLDCAKNI